jgi:hypothetical protein
VLYQTFTTWPGAARFRGLSPQEHEGVVEMNRRDGLWLRAHDEPWIPAQLWATITKRAYDALRMCER